MEITLNHTVIPARDRVKSAEWYQEIFGFEFLKVWGPFAVVKVNSTLTLDFSEREGEIQALHLAFKVNDQQFDEIFGRINAKNIGFCSSPQLVLAESYDHKINHRFGGRGVYFKDPNGHNLEILTADYDLDNDPS